MPVWLKSIVRKSITNCFTFISVYFPNMTSMVAENLALVPEMATIPGISEMTGEHFGQATAAESTTQGQVDAITRLLRLSFKQMARQQAMIQTIANEIATYQAGTQPGPSSTSQTTTTPITENSATETMYAPGVSASTPPVVNSNTWYEDAKFFPKIQQLAKDVGKFNDDTFRTWRQRFRIQLKALAPKLRASLEMIEKDENHELGAEYDANLYAALTQQCDGNLTSILGLHNVAHPGKMAWRHMMERTDIKENIFRASIETKFNHVRRCNTLPKFVEFMDLIEATERTIIEKRN